MIWPPRPWLIPRNQLVSLIPRSHIPRTLLLEVRVQLTILPRIIQEILARAARDRAVEVISHIAGVTAWRRVYVEIIHIVFALIAFINPRNVSEIDVSTDDGFGDVDGGRALDGAVGIIVAEKTGGFLQLAFVSVFGLLRGWGGAFGCGGGINWGDGGLGCCG